MIILSLNIRGIGGSQKRRSLCKPFEEVWSDIVLVRDYG